MPSDVPEATPHTKATLTIGDNELFYQLYGEGEPLLLLHGFILTAEYWSTLIPALAARYQLIVPDLLGHGRSTNPSGVFTHRQAARDVSALLDHLDVPSTRAAGFSSGAEVLLHIAVREPTRLSAQVIIAGMHYETLASREISREWYYDDLPPAFLRYLHEIHAGGETQVRALCDQMRAGADDLDDMSFTPPHLARISTPTLIIVGDRDAFVPLPVAMEMFTHLPEAYLWVVPNGNHMLHRADRGGRFPGKEALPGVMLEFLSGAWGESG